jgi:hypothetical protein
MERRAQANRKHWRNIGCGMALYQGLTMESEVWRILYLKEDCREKPYFKG